MPKDATKNIDRYKIKGGQLNEFDFQKNQEEFAEASRPETNLIPGTPPEKRIEEALPFVAKPVKKVARGASTKSKKTSTSRAATKKTSKPKAAAKKSAKTTKAAKASKTTKSRPRGATAKKLAARKAAKK